jgi:hypothetical protein
MSKFREELRGELDLGLLVDHAHIVEILKKVEKAAFEVLR